MTYVKQRKGWRTSCDVVKRRKGWRMSCDVGEVTERLENELCYQVRSKTNSYIFLPRTFSNFPVSRAVSSPGHSSPPVHIDRL